MKERIVYAARIRHDRDGYVAEFPQLDLVTNGKDLNDVLYMASDALETHCTGYADDEATLPKTDLDIAVRKGEKLAIVSVYVDPVYDIDQYDMTTKDVVSALGVNKQRVQQLRDTNAIRSYKQGRDYLHHHGDVVRLAGEERKAGRPKR